MLGFLRDKVRTVRMKARYERLVQERVMEMVESNSPQVVSEDPGRWSLLGGGKSEEVGFSSGDLRSEVRKLVRTHPHAQCFEIVGDICCWAGIEDGSQPRIQAERKSHC